MFLREDFIDKFARELLPVIKIKTFELLESYEGTKKLYGYIRLEDVKDL
jgi:hypothetical protein